MSTLDTIRTLTLKATTDGFDDAAKSVKELADAQGGLAVVSDTVSKSTLSAATSLNRLQSQLDPTYRLATQLNNAQATLGKAFDQGLVSVDRYNQLMGLAGQKFDVASKSTSPFATALTGVKTQLVAMSAGLGPVGTALAAFGPVGLAAGAGIAVVADVMGKLNEMADGLASKTVSLSAFAQVTDLTTDQVQALSSASVKVGVSMDDTQRFIDSFTAKLTELKTASGPLYEAVLKVDASIAQQMLTAKGTTAQLDLYAAAYAKAAAAGNGNSLLVAAGGRGAVTEGPVISSIASAGGLDALNSSMDQGSRLSTSLIQNLKDLKTANDALKEDRDNNIASVFSESLLTRQKQFLETQVALSESVKNFSLSGDWSKFISDLETVAKNDLKQSLPSLFNSSTPTRVMVTGGTEAPAAYPAGAVTSAPLQAAQIDPAAVANQYKTLVGVLGSGADITDQFDSKLASLVVTARAAGVPADKLSSITGDLTDKLNASGGAAAALSRGIQGLNLDKASALQQMRNSSIGSTPTAAQLLQAKADRQKSDDKTERSHVSDQRHLPAAA